MKPKIFEKSIAKRFNSYEKQKTTHRKKWLHLKQLHFVKNTFHMKNMLFQMKSNDFTRDQIYLKQLIAKWFISYEKQKRNTYIQS